MLFELAKETSWSLHTLLWEVNRVTLYAMLADRSRFETQAKEEDTVIQDSGENYFARHNNK